MKRLIPLLALLATAPQAQGTLTDQTVDASDRLAEAQMMLQSATASDRPVAALTAAIKAYDDGLIAARQNLQLANAEMDNAKDRFDPDGTDTANLIITLMAARPDAATLPSGPTESLRASMMRKDVAGALQAQADTLGNHLRELADAEEAQAAALKTLQTGLSGAQQAREDLRAALADRAPLANRFEEDPVQAALISANVNSFGQAATLLSTLYPAGLPNDAVLVAKGQIPQPVTGRKLAAFGTANAEGQQRAGTTFATPPAALVVSPTAATILYQGPMLAFDNVVIIEPTTGVTVVLAGLAEVFVQAGQIIPSGDPLGIMGGELIAADTNLTSFSATTHGGASQALYLEVREMQTLVDPASWFAIEQQVVD